MEQGACQLVSRRGHVYKAFAALAAALAAAVDECHRVRGVRATGPKLREAARAALALDDTIGEGGARGQGRDAGPAGLGLQGAEQAHQRAVELAPNSGLVRMAYAHHLGMLARYDDSLREAYRATELDPSAASTTGELFWASTHAQRFQECVDIAKRTDWYDQTDPTRAFVQAWADHCHARLGRVQEVCARTGESPV